jgi:hypothetical protein
MDTISRCVKTLLPLPFEPSIYEVVLLRQVVALEA